MICEKCGRSVNVGDWPFCPHGQVPISSPMRNNPFVPYFDDGLGEMVHSHSERTKMLRDSNLVYRDRTGKPGCEV